MSAPTMLQSTKPISPYQFALFRILLGVYLAWHFIALLPYGAELFSDTGIFPDPSINLTSGIFPNPLEWSGTSAMVTICLSIAVLCSILLTLGLYRRSCCVILWFVWACLFNRNNLIANPGLPYIGLILLLCACLPRGDALSLRKKNAPPENWQFPSLIYWTAWTLLAVGYTFSGAIKLGSPSWIDGTAMTHVVNNPLARPGWIRDLFLSLPEGVTKTMTWTTLGLEVGFVLASFHRLSRLFAWTALLFLHVGIMMLIDFADLSLGMILIHLFTFDPRWFPARKPANNTDQLVFFDGECLLCKGSVQFLMTEDRENVLTFATLQGDTAKSRLPAEHQELRSILYIQAGKITSRSTAVLDVLDTTGGMWRPLSWIGRLIPPRVRDFGYDTIANNRYKWFGHQEDACSLLPPSQRSRIVD